MNSSELPKSLISAELKDIYPGVFQQLSRQDLLALSKSNKVLKIKIDEYLKIIAENFKLLFPKKFQELENQVPKVALPEFYQLALNELKANISERCQQYNVKTNTTTLNAEIYYNLYLRALACNNKAKAKIFIDALKEYLKKQENPYDFLEMYLLKITFKGKKILEILPRSNDKENNPIIFLIYNELVYPLLITQVSAQEVTEKKLLWQLYYLSNNSNNEPVTTDVSLWKQNHLLAAIAMGKKAVLEDIAKTHPALQLVKVDEKADKTGNQQDKKNLEGKKDLEDKKIFLACAIRHGQAEILTFLLDKFEIKSNNYELYEYLLEVAAEYGQMDIAALLCKNGGINDPEKLSKIAIIHGQINFYKYMVALREPERHDRNIIGKHELTLIFNNGYFKLLYELLNKKPPDKEALRTHRIGKDFEYFKHYLEDAPQKNSSDIYFFIDLLDAISALSHTENKLNIDFLIPVLKSATADSPYQRCMLMKTKFSLALHNIKDEATKAILKQSFAIFDNVLPSDLETKKDYFVIAMAYEKCANIINQQTANLGQTAASLAKIKQRNYFLLNVAFSLLLCLISTTLLTLTFGASLPASLALFGVALNLMLYVSGSLGIVGGFFNFIHSAAFSIPKHTGIANKMNTFFDKQKPPLTSGPPKNTSIIPTAAKNNAKIKKRT